MSLHHFVDSITHGVQPPTSAWAAWMFATAADIPGENEVGPIFHGEPALAVEVAYYVGCPVGAVIATRHEAARRPRGRFEIDWGPLPAHPTTAYSLSTE